MTPQERMRYGKLIAAFGPRAAPVLAAMAEVLDAAGEREQPRNVVDLMVKSYVLGLAVGVHQPAYAKALLAMEGRTREGEDAVIAGLVVTEVAPLARDTDRQ